MSKQLPSLLSFVLIFCNEASAEMPSSSSLRVWHLNPERAGAIPTNMDTGNIPGDLAFYLGQFLFPIECQNMSSTTRASFDCDNVEEKGALVATQVDLEINPNFGTYSECNICNGTDIFGKPCPKGSYFCNCVGDLYGLPHCDATKVGKRNVSRYLSPDVPPETCKVALNTSCGAVQKAGFTSCYECIKSHREDFLSHGCEYYDFDYFCDPVHKWHHCDSSTPAWQCWIDNNFRKAGGNTMWYSTQKEGQCKGDMQPGSSCSWKVKATITVQETCLRDKVMTVVEDWDPACFTACGPRNSSSPCWIGCFFDTLLGPAARHSVTVELSGIPVEKVEQAWASAFLPEEQGGCAPMILQGTIPPTLNEVLV